MKKCNNEHCEKKELCDRFLLEGDESWDEWFKSLPENFKKMMCEHYIDETEDKQKEK